MIISYPVDEVQWSSPFPSISILPESNTLCWTPQNVIRKITYSAKFIYPHLEWASECLHHQYQQELSDVLAYRIAPSVVGYATYSFSTINFAYRFLEKKFILTPSSPPPLKPNKQHIYLSPSVGGISNSPLFWLVSCLLEQSIDRPDMAIRSEIKIPF